MTVAQQCLALCLAGPGARMCAPSPDTGHGSAAASPHAPLLAPRVDSAAASVQQLLDNAEQEQLIRASLGCTVVGRAGSGHYGSVLLAQCGDNDAVVIKLAPHPSPTLEVEATVLQAMAGVQGFPALHSYGAAVGGSGLDAIVMERLGPSIHDLWKQQTQSTCFSGPAVLQYGRSILRCLQSLHEAGFVHNDVKPNNVLLGREQSARADSRQHVLHLIDFGLATGTTDTLGDERGTPLFASIAAHERQPTRPVHDIESLVYCLAYLAAGSLPWERKPAARAASIKRRMLTDGCSTLVDGCTADRLTEHTCAHEAAEALQLLWLQVVTAHGADDGRVDYAACWEALCGDSESF